MSRPFDSEKFWSHVSTTAPDACWSWQARTDDDGYGIYYDLGKHHRAHRIAYEVTTSERPPVVMHRCDNPACCNPDHLRGGTQRENMRDKIRKGRQATGSQNGRSKLDEEQVRQIKRELQKEDTVQAQLARAYGVSKSVIRDIKSGKTWRHVQLT